MRKPQSLSAQSRFATLARMRRSPKGARASLIVEPFEIIAIALNPSFVAQCFQDTINCDWLRFQECRAEYDPGIAQFATRFEAELSNSNYGGTLYGESLGLAFSLYLLEKYSESSLTLPQGKLSSRQLKEIIEYIHAHLGKQLSLSELATQLNFSTFHFARLFKKSLGLSRIVARVNINPRE